MKIVPLTLLKTGATGKIVEIVEMSDSPSSQKVIKHLLSVGFYPGQDVQMIKKFGDIYSVKAGTDNPFAIGKKLVKTIQVSAEEADVFENEKASKQAESLMATIRRTVDFIKSKVQKN